MKNTVGKLCIALLVFLSLGAVLAALDGKDTWVEGWLGYSVLLAAAGLANFGAWKMVRGTRQVGVAAISAFLARLLLGVCFMLILPEAGFQDNPASQMGYLYKDAFIRDQQAWTLASSESSVLDAFSGAYSGDQYGGLLSLSALVYRLLGFGFHRPWLILILTAAVSGMGVCWLWKAARGLVETRLQSGALEQRLDARSFIPMAAAWIFALYPEAVFLGSAHMREPFVMSFAALSLFSLTQAREKPRGWWLWFLLSMIVLFLFQLPAALAVALLSIGLLWFENRQSLSWKSVVFIVGVALIGALLVIWNWKNLPSLASSNPLSIFATWLQNNYGFQSYLVERQSGMVQKMAQGAGKQWMLPIILVYGFAQPVLPATIVDPTVWFWRFFNMIRAAGWYFLAFLLIYNLVGICSARLPFKRTTYIGLNLAVFAWILVSAANAGGDMWDNPRYRVMFLAYQALLAAWSLWQAYSTKSPWLWRWLAVEGVFILAFLEWYISRYFPAIPHFSIWAMIAFTLAASGLILIGGWIWDWKRMK